MMNAVIQVKPHVKQFLTTQCGESPTNLKLLPDIWKYYKDLLKNPIYHDDHRKIANYNDEIYVVISDDMFYRYGYELTKNNTVKFNNYIDKLIKNMSRQFISIQMNFGVKQTVAACKFIEAFNFADKLDPHTIAKDFYRNNINTRKNHLYNMMFKEIEKNFMANLNQNGMISQYYINNYLTLNDK